MTYAAELNDNDEVVQVIVGTAEWATVHLGGRWVDTPHKCGPGWVWNGDDIVPPEPEPEPEDEQ